MYFIRSFILCSTLLMASRAGASTQNFKVSAPSNWELIEKHEAGATYRNRKASSPETIVLSKFEARAPTSLIYERIAHSIRGIEAVRNQALRHLGLRDYSILSVEAKNQKRNANRTALIFEARAIGVSGEELQIVERQFVQGKTIFQIVYVEASVALRNRERVEQTLNNFQPIFSADRIPAASEMVNANSGMSIEPKMPASEAFVLLPPVNSPKLSATCAEISEQYKRSNDEPLRLDGELFKGMAAGCKDFVAEKVSWKSLKSLMDNWVNPTKVASDLGAQVGMFVAKKMGVTIPEAYDQSSSAVAVALADFTNNPKEYGASVFSNLYSHLSKSVPGVQCWKAEEIGKVVCKFASFLLPLGLLAKVGHKGALTAAELAQINRFSKEVATAVVGKRASVGSDDVTVAAARMGSLPARKLTATENAAVNSALQRAAKTDVVVTEQSLKNYISSKEAKETIEVLWFPRSYNARQPGFGHMGVRVDDKIYHINPSGVHVEDYVKYMGDRFANGHNAFGHAFNSTPGEKAKIAEYFAKNKDLKFHRYKQNCSETVCMSLNEAGIVRLPKALALDPAVSSQLIKRLARPGHRAVYSQSGFIPREITRENLLLRTGVAGPLVGATAFTATTASVLLQNALYEMEEDR